MPSFFLCCFLSFVGGLLLPRPLLRVVPLTGNVKSTFEYMRWLTGYVSTLTACEPCMPWIQARPSCNHALAITVLRANARERANGADGDSVHFLL